MRRSLIGFRVIGVVLLLGLAGCGGDPKTDPSPAPSTPVTSPASTTPSPPAMPDAARANTRAGAIAFVRHYIELINYAQATGDVNALSAVEDRACKSCASVRRALRDIYNSGGHIEGGAWRVHVRSSAPRPDLSAWSVFTDVEYGKQTVVRDSKMESLGGGTSPMTFVIKPVDGSWVVLKWSRAS
jgi:hypothetical protein